MTIDADVELGEAARIETDALVNHARARIADGSNPAAVAMAMLGCGADLLARVLGDVTAAREINNIACELARKSQQKKNEKPH